MKYVLLCAGCLLILSANFVLTNQAKESSEDENKQRFNTDELNYYK